MAQSPWRSEKRVRRLREEPVGEVRPEVLARDVVGDLHAQPLVET
jgi:hypothetical protein